MYNGIGLNTPRGSGTSGHVVRNASALRPGQNDKTRQQRSNRYDADSAPKPKPMDQGILDHERKRQVEIKCLELQDTLEDQGLDEDQIEEQVEELRQSLLKNLDQVSKTLDTKKIKPFERQRLQEAKDRENLRFARAMRVEDGYMEGAAFDRELQELRRQKKMLEKEREKLKREVFLDSESDTRRRRKYRRRRSNSYSSSDSESTSGSESDHRRSRNSRKRSRRRSRSTDSGSESSSSDGALSSEESEPEKRSGRSKDSKYSRKAEDRKHTRETESSAAGLDEKAKDNARPETAESVTSRVRPVDDGEPGEIEDVDTEQDKHADVTEEEQGN